MDQGEAPRTTRLASGPTTRSARGQHRAVAVGRCAVDRTMRRCSRVVARQSSARNENTGHWGSLVVEMVGTVVMMVMVVMFGLVGLTQSHRQAALCSPNTHTHLRQGGVPPSRCTQEHQQR